MVAPLDIQGKRFGRLLATQDVGRDKWGSVIWLCECNCGNTLNVTSSNLSRGNTTSCGCAHTDAITKHGMSATLIYSVYRSMISRCDNPNDPNYKTYGGRGICYSSSWETFEGFYEEMSQGYMEGLTLDRTNPNGDYCKENCRWIPLSEQAYSKTLFSTNQSGVAGVHYDKWGDRWKARWHEYPSGKGRQKAFPVKKYGENAFNMACEHRAKMINEQIEKGAPYTMFHGGAKE